MNIKIVLLGTGGAGKSALLIQYISGHFVQKYDPTIEDCYRKLVEVEGLNAILEIFDTAGQEEYETLTDYYIQRGEIFIIFYSIISRSTFHSVHQWRRKILRSKGRDEVPIILVGTKIDLESERQVSREEGEELAKQYKMLFFEASGCTGVNVNEIFYEAVKLHKRAFSFKISYLEKKKEALKSWQIIEKKKIKKKLKSLYHEEQLYNINLKKSKLESDLKSTLSLPPIPSFKISHSTFIQDFKYLINDKESCDQIVEIESKPYYIHRLMLKLRCPSILSLLGNERNAKLEYISYSSFNVLMEYIYTGFIPTNFNSCSTEYDFEELLQFSKIYNLNLFSNLCLNPNQENDQASREQFEMDIKTLYNNSFNSDITIKTFSSLEDKSEEKIFHSHKLILIARSSWFRSFLSNQWKESKEEFIQIKEIDSESFEGLMEYLYTDTLSIEKYNPDTLVRLIDISDQFTLIRLREICESLLADFLSIETIIPLYQFSILHEANQLTERCIYFMSQPEIFTAIKQQGEFSLIEPSIQEKIQQDCEHIATLLEKRNYTLRLIQKLTFGLKLLSP